MSANPRAVAPPAPRLLATTLVAAVLLATLAGSLLAGRLLLGSPAPVDVVEGHVGAFDVLVIGQVVEEAFQADPVGLDCFR